MYTLQKQEYYAMVCDSFREITKQAKRPKVDKNDSLIGNH